MTDDYPYWLGLSHTLVTARGLLQAINTLGSAKAVWHASQTALAAWLKPSSLERFVAARAALVPERLWPVYETAGIQVVPYMAPAYPTLLKQIHDPPLVLYVRGAVGSLSPTRSLSVVGTRRVSDYGQRVVAALFPQIAPYGPTIISGLAAGVDTLAHDHAIKNGMPTVAVFGTGIDRIFPKENTRLAERIIGEGGALVSEYPLGTDGNKYTFPQRNRIIAGLSMGTLVVEGNATSGALITAKLALNENRQVLAVPGTIFSTGALGPHKLIQAGAVLVQCGEDIANAMQWTPMPMALGVGSGEAVEADGVSDLLAALSTEERLVLAAIDPDPTAFDIICQKQPQLSTVAIQTALTMLELQGWVSALPGAKFCRNQPVSVLEVG